MGAALEVSLDHWAWIASVDDWLWIAIPNINCGLVALGMFATIYRRRYSTFRELADGPQGD
jgi:hypothetical protein